MGRTGTLAATTVASAIVFVDTTVVNVALPAVREELGGGLVAQQWVVEAYLLTLGSLILIGGSLGDLLGRRRIFALGVAGFGVASLAAALAPTAEVLIGVRALQGVAGALLVPSSLAIITACWTGEERGRAIGLWTAGTSAAIAVGPPIGGALVDLVSWRAIFLINLPLVALVLWLTRREMPALPGRGARRIDWVGAALAALGLGGLVFALIEQSRVGWSDPLVLAPGLAALALLAAFVVWERRGTDDPMVPLGLFASRNFSVANAATLAVYAGLGAATFFVVIFLQQVAGYGATEAGFALLPLTLVMVTLSRWFGGLTPRIGPRPLMGAGPLVAAGGLLLFLRLDAEASFFADVAPASALFGLGMAITVAPLTTTVLSSVDESRAGVASGVNNAVARIAGLLAIAVVGAIVAARFDAALDGGAGDQRPLVVPEGAAQALVDASVSAFQAGMLASAALVAIGGLLSLVALDNRRATEAV